MTDESDTIVHRVQEAWSGTDPIGRTWAALFKLFWEGGLAALFATALIGIIFTLGNQVQEVEIRFQAGIIGAWTGIFLITFRMLFCRVVVSTLPPTDEDEDEQTRLDAIEAQAGGESEQTR